jgi:hypothetical protein
MTSISSPCRSLFLLKPTGARLGVDTDRADMARSRVLSSREFRELEDDGRAGCGILGV